MEICPSVSSGFRFSSHPLIAPNVDALLPPFFFFFIIVYAFFRFLCLYILFRSIFNCRNLKEEEKEEEEEEEGCKQQQTTADDETLAVMQKVEIDSFQSPVESSRVEAEKSRAEYDEDVCDALCDRRTSIK